MWAKPTNTFRLCKLTIAKQLAVRRLEHNGVSLYKCDSNKKAIRYIMKKVNYFFSKRLSPVLTNLVLARKQRGCLRLINCNIGKYYGRCPNPQFLKKLSKLFCFWEDNLALAKFQCPTDTPLNHNLLLLSKHLE